MAEISLYQLERLVRFYKNLSNEILSIADNAVIDSSNELLNINRNQLEDYGQDSEGLALKYKHKRSSPVGTAYTRAYERFKEKRGGQIQYVDLKLTGQFINSIRLDHTAKGKFKFNVDESQADLYGILQYNYGKNILGLQEDNLQKYADKYLQPVIEYRLEQEIEKI